MRARLRPARCPRSLLARDGVARIARATLLPLGERHRAGGAHAVSERLLRRCTARLPANKF